MTIVKTTFDRINLNKDLFYSFLKFLVHFCLMFKALKFVTLNGFEQLSFEQMIIKNDIRTNTNRTIDN